MTHRHWRRLYHNISLVCGFMLLACYALHAQSIYPPAAAPPPAPPPEQQGSALPLAPPCVGCYQGFAFDTVFRMGAHFNGSWAGAPQMLKDTLHIGITQMYNQPYLNQIVRGMADPDARTAWVDTLRFQFWKDLKAADVKVVIQPGDYSEI